MSSLLNMPTFHALFLFTIALTFYKLHASQSSTYNSLTFSLTHSKLAKDGSSSSFSDRVSQNQSLPIKEIPDGFVMSISLGTPPQLIQKLFFDTGSDLIWVPSGNQSNPFQCQGCDNNYYKNLNLTIYNPLSSTSRSRESCLSLICADIHGNGDYHDTCTAVGCSLFSLLNNTCDRPCPSFNYEYGDGIVAGSMTRDTLVVLPDNNNDGSNNPNISFGCVRTTYREPIGIVGFGKGRLSFPSQLGFLGKGFAHCFLPFDYSSNPNYSTPLILGDQAISSKEYMQFTPMQHNPLYPNFYYIGLEGITVGNTTTIPAPEILRHFDSSLNGGMIIDSGTRSTHLPDPFYSDLRKAIGSVVKYPRAPAAEAGTGFDLCYRIPVSATQPYDLPSITFHFLNNVSLALPQGSLFYKVAPPINGTRPVCLLFERMDDDPEASGVFGSSQQESVEVVYDLENKRIGFHVTDCVSYGK